MLNPDVIVEAIVSCFRSIPEVVQEMTGNSDRIRGYHNLFASPDEDVLEQEIYSMKPPSILVIWDSTYPANVDGMTLFKHRFLILVRSAPVLSEIIPCSYGKLWWYMMNRPVLGQGLNIRSLEILPDLQLVDVPSVVRRTDAAQADYLVGTMIFPEKGDAID